VTAMDKELVTLLIIGGGLWVLIQFAGLRFWHAVVAFGAGFYLASGPAGSQAADLASRILAALGH
jgi:hypothetical protein